MTDDIDASEFIVEEHLNEKAKPKKRKRKWRFNVFTKERVASTMPFIFFLATLAIIYISNSYYAEKNIRDIDMTTKELRQLKSEYVATKRMLEDSSRQTVVAKKALALNLKDSAVAPRKITILTADNK